MINLRLGDCLDLMPTLDDNSQDAIIADIPYGTTSCAWDTVIPFDAMWKELKRIAKPKAAIILFGSQPFTSALIMSNPDWFRDEWIWRKNRGGDVFNSQKRPLKFHENIIVFAEQQPTYNPQGLRKSSKSRSLRTAGSIFYAERDKPAYVQNFEGYPTTLLEYSITETSHPTQKPVALMEYLIRTYTNEGDTVLDFTMGSGTTMVACVRAKRNGIGYELDSGYFAKAEKRVQDARAEMGEVAKILAPNLSIAPMFV